MTGGRSVHWQGDLTGAGKFVEDLAPLPDDARGVFETVRVTPGDRMPRLWARHAMRLRASIHELCADPEAPSLDQAWWESLESLVADVLARGSGASAPGASSSGASASGAASPCAVAADGVAYLRLRIAVSWTSRYPEEGPAPALRLSLGPAPPAPPKVLLAPVFVTEVPRVRERELKRLDRRFWGLAQSIARAKDADEALRIDAGGLALETTNSSLFAVCGGRLVTPPSDGRILAGVARRALIDRLQAQGVPVQVRPVPWAEVRQAEALWVTNALRGPRPAWLLGTEGPASACPLGALLISAWQRLVDA